MANEFATYLKAKGSEADLARFKNDFLKRCTVLRRHQDDSPDGSAADYLVDLAAWNPGRKDWAEDRLPWWLELARGKSELLPIKDGELNVVAGSRGGPAIHFLDGLRELYPGLVLSAYAIDLCSGVGEEWRCSRDRTFCVDEVMSCWEGEEVWYWKKDGRLMIDGRKPVAEELLEFAATPFVIVEGVPMSLALDVAKEHVRRQVEQGRKDLAYMLEGGTPLSVLSTDVR